MSVYVHRDWLLHYYQAYYRSSRASYFTASLSLALLALLAVSLLPAQAGDHTTEHMAAFLGGLAFAVFLLATMLLLFAGVHDEQITAALAFEKELEWRECKGKALSDAWHRSLNTEAMWSQRGVRITEGAQGEARAKHWRDASRAEIYRRRKQSFLLAAAGRLLVLVGCLLLLATLAFVGKLKIAPHTAGSGLWIALLAVLSITGVLIVVLVGHQDVHEELFNPGPAPIRISNQL